VNSFGGGYDGGNPIGGVTITYWSGGYFLATTASWGGQLGGGTFAWGGDSIYELSGSDQGGLFQPGPSASLLADPADNCPWQPCVFYGTTYTDGYYQAGSVFRGSLTCDACEGCSWSYTDLHDFDWSDGAYVAAGVALGTDGYLYGTASEGGAHGAGSVWRIGGGRDREVASTANSQCTRDQ
jgi:uncharacterized repeat protein (TIGR03803 family)